MRVRAYLVPRFARPARPVACYVSVRRAGAVYGRMSFRSYRRAQARAGLSRFDVLDLAGDSRLAVVCVGSLSRGVWYPRCEVTKNK